MAQTPALGFNRKWFGRQANQALTGADPNVAASILENYVDLIIGHFVVVQLVVESSLDETVEPAIGSHPQGIPAVLINGADEIIRQPEKRCIDN